MSDETILVERLSSGRYCASRGTDWVHHIDGEERAPCNEFRKPRRAER